MAATESSRKITGGCLYSVEERLKTFEGSHWPFDSGLCTPLKMAEAGFYYCGTATNPDWVRCVVCHYDMDGWEEADVPRDEHKKHNPSCPFIKKIQDPYLITVGDALELEKEALKIYVKKESQELREVCYKCWEQIRGDLYSAIENMPD